MSQSHTPQQNQTVAGNPNSLAVAQAKVQINASNQRQAVKGAGKTAIWRIIPIIACILVGLFYWKDYQTNKIKNSEVEEKVAKVATAEQKDTSAKGVTGSNKTLREDQVAFEKLADDGSLPINAWSKTMKIQVGCTVEFDPGNGSAYKLQTRLYGEWEDHVPGTNVRATDIQYMILKPGIKKIPVVVHCPY